MFKCVRPLAGKTFQKEFRSAGWCKENRDGQKTVAEDRIPDDLQHSFRNSDACDHDPEKYEHAGSKVTTIHGGNTTTRMIKRFTMADDLKESSKIIQVKGTMLKDHYLPYKDST
ncbi:hypothetical protein Tco_0580522 [Tanacetum coccineum]